MRELGIGTRVFITDKKHPWYGRGGEVISGQEAYGLGWMGQRVRVDGSGDSETYVVPRQVMTSGGADSTRITRVRRKR